jgi:hypothetical protein
MRRKWWAAGLVGSVVSVAQAAAPASPDDVTVLEPVVLQAPDAPKGKDGPPAKDVPPKKDEPTELARTDPAAEAAPGYFSRMLGDLPFGGYATRYVVLPGTAFVTGQTFTTTTKTLPSNNEGRPGTYVITTPVRTGTFHQVMPATVVTQAQVPLFGRGGFKVGENEAALPEDRFFLTFNGFDGLVGAIPPLPSTTTTGTYPAATEVFKPFGGPLAPIVGRPVATIIPGLGTGPAIVTTVPTTPQSTLFREVIGLEKTILDGQASVGLRAPFFQVRGDGSLSADDFGDVTVVFKYRVLATRDAGAAVGLAVTLPTGPAIPTVEGNIHSTLWQPFVGGRVSAGDVFATAFSSVVLPSDPRDTKAWFNDLQVGFTVYQGRPTDFISSLAPVTEVHVTTPLQGKRRLVYVPDVVDLTVGVEVGLGPTAVLNLGVVIPVTGPRPFDWEGVVQLNFRF